VDLLLVRHGLPLRVEVAEGALADPSLSEEGREQAERLAGWLAQEQVDALYSSPMRRAAETAAPLATQLGLAPTLEPDLVEVDHQSNRYVPLEELKATDYPRWRALVSEGGLYAGVDVAAFRATVVAAIERIIAAERSRRVVVTCHGGVINAYASHLLGIEDLFVFEPAYTGISRFRAASSGERSIVSLNEAAHLR
jgi:broad specificity phosphatase PhoE